MSLFYKRDSVSKVRTVMSNRRHGSLLEASLALEKEILYSNMSFAKEILYSSMSFAFVHMNIGFFLKKETLLGKEILYSSISFIFIHMNVGSHFRCCSELCCSVLQCIALCCSGLCCSVWQ